MTQDANWEKVRANAKASLLMTRTAEGYQDKPHNRKLGITLAWCEAALRHTRTAQTAADPPEPGTVQIVRAIRRCIARPDSDALTELAAQIDAIFDWILIGQGRPVPSSTLQVDACTALGWAAKTVLCVRAEEYTRAAHANFNAMSSVMRILNRTGYSQAEVEALTTELQQA